MSFVPQHVNPVVLTFAAMGIARLLDRQRWWFVALPTVIGLTIGFVLDTVGTSVQVVPLVPFSVDVATVAIVAGIAFSRIPTRTP